MAEASAVAGVRALAEKGEGMLVRHASGVWSYPGASIDLSGTNLVLPMESVTDAAVQEALGGEDFVVVTRNPDNTPRSIRVVSGDQPVVVMSTAAAGTAEAGTELPLNSRPSHDAGAARLSPQEAADLVTRASQQKPASEGGESKPIPADSETAASVDMKRVGRNRQ